MQSEQAFHIRQMIALLPIKRQEVVILKFFGGLRNKEIAAVLDLDERTVASHLSRALTDLKRLLVTEDHDDSA
jgi:RNA polymerase sigma factor (sigma-70 family)